MKKFLGLILVAGLSLTLAFGTVNAAPVQDCGQHKEGAKTECTHEKKASKNKNEKKDAKKSEECCKAKKSEECCKAKKAEKQAEEKAEKQ